MKKTTSIKAQQNNNILSTIFIVFAILLILGMTYYLSSHLLSTNSKASMIQPPYPSMQPPTNSYIYMVNSASGKTCKTLCEEAGFTCITTGTNKTSNDRMYVTNENGTCIKVRDLDCNQVMRDDRKKYCFGKTSEWTTCKCNQQAAF